jgi:hypothetical protein
VGYLLYLQPGDRPLGDMALRRWHEVRALLPLLLDYVGRAAGEGWGPGTARAVAVSVGGASPAVPPEAAPPPAGGPFDLGRMLCETRLREDYVDLVGAGEWERLLAWCDFLAGRDGVFGLYRPLADTLRPYVARMASQRGPAEPAAAPPPADE